MARVGSYVRCTVRPIIQNKIYIFSLKFVLKPYRDYFDFGGLDYILVDLFR